MIKYCASSKLIPLLARLYYFMINEQMQPEGFNVSIIKPLIKNDKKHRPEYSMDLLNQVMLHDFHPTA